LATLWLFGAALLPFFMAIMTTPARSCVHAWSAGRKPKRTRRYRAHVSPIRMNVNVLDVTFW
jgi:hypothetical protein